MKDLLIDQRSGYTNKIIMGWDAHSSAEYCYELNRIKDDQLDSSFKKAALRVEKKCGNADGYLRIGSLDCSKSGLFLSKATGDSIFGDKWHPMKVLNLYRSANWNFEYKEEDAWAYWSAKAFLEVCAMNALEISFSW